MVFFLQILPPNCTKFVFFCSTLRKLSSDLESPHFPIFPQNAANSKSGREMVIENQEISKGHGKVMEKYFVKSVGTL